MKWNWELEKWPQFQYDADEIRNFETSFLLKVGSASAYLKTINLDDFNQYIVEILSIEGVESAKIEGEILERKSLQSSIKKHFGLSADLPKGNNKEISMANLLFDVYEHFDKPLSHDLLWNWHATLFKASHHIADIGKYRTHSEPMQIVSNRYDKAGQVFFEAPPSKRVKSEMNKYIEWFNQSSPNDSILGKAAIAHIYFESIHPFEDGNGRIGRVLSEKILSQAINRPILIALSKVLEHDKKDYYSSLGYCNHSLDAGQWVRFFSQAIIKAHEESLRLLQFLVEKAKLFNRLKDQINLRQTKALLRMFKEGPEGFNGGLSAENYIAITKTSRATATRDLKDLVKKEALFSKGELKHTRYFLNVPLND